MSAGARKSAAFLFTFLPILLLMGCGLRGLHVPQSPLLKLFESKSGRIAYVGVGGDLFISDQTGSQTRLTNDAQSTGGGHVSYVAPTWSPNGDRIAFARYLTNTADGTSTATLRVIDVRTKRSTTLLSSSTVNPFYIDWSPDGSHLTILSSVGSGHLELGLAAADTPESYTKLDSGQPYYSTWTTDGDAVLAHTDFGPGKAGRVSIIPLSPDAQRTDLPGSFGLFQTPASLPHGGLIAGVRDTGPTARLALLTPTAGVQRYLSRPSREGFLFSVSPNRRFLAYLVSTTSSGSTKSTLHVVDIESGEPQQRFESTSTVGFYWSPDSSMIAFITPAAGRSVAAPYAQISSLPRVTLRVLRVASGKTWSIATFPPTQGVLTTLPYTDQYQRSQTIWAPDGKHLVYTAYASDGLPGVFVADSSGNVAPMKIASGDSATWSWK